MLENGASSYIFNMRVISVQLLNLTIWTSLLKKVLLIHKFSRQKSMKTQSTTNMYTHYFNLLTASCHDLSVTLHFISKLVHV